MTMNVLVNATQEDGRYADRVCDRESVHTRTRISTASHHGADALTFAPTRAQGLLISIHAWTGAAAAAASGGDGGPGLPRWEHVRPLLCRFACI